MKTLVKPVYQVKCGDQAGVVSGSLEQWAVDKGVTVRKLKSGEERLYFGAKRLFVESFTVESLEAMAYIFGGRWKALAEECIQNVPA